MVIRWIFLGIIAGIIYKTVQQYRRGQTTRQEAINWVVFWLIGAGVILRPEVTTSVAQWVGVGRGVDLIIYLSLIGTFYFLFRFALRMEALEHHITDIVRHEALTNWRKHHD